MRNLMNPVQTYCTKRGAKVQLYWISQKEIQDILIHYKISDYELKILVFLIEKDDPFIKAEHIYKTLNLDRGWTFKSLRKLEDLNYISRYNGWIGPGGMATVIIARVESCIEKHLS